MRTSNLIVEAEKCLEQQRYTKSTIHINYKRHWNAFAKSVGGEKTFYPRLVYDYLTQNEGRNTLDLRPAELSPKEYRKAHAFASLICFYESRTTPGTSMAGALVREELPAFDAKCLGSYMAYLKSEEFSPNALRYAFNEIHNYLIAYPMAQLDNRQLIEYFSSLACFSKATAKSKLRVMKRFLGFCFEAGLMTQDFRSLIPSRKRFSRTEIPSVYAPSEIFQLLEHVKQFGAQNTKRNYAIILLIATYGLRASDVFAMKVSDINWENEKIYIVQSKTGVALTHRLTGRAAAALTDYMLNEREDSTSAKLFLQADGSDIGSAVTISTMICHAFSNSSISINGRKHGSHCLRHSLVSNMLANDAGILAASKALGHTSVDSTKIYSKVDVNRLKMCELEVPAYE